MDMFAGVRALYQSIAAALQLGLSGRRRSPVLNSIYQAVGLSRIFTACLGHRGGGACLRDSFTAFKRSIKKACDRFIQPP